MATEAPGGKAKATRAKKSNPKPTKCKPGGTSICSGATGACTKGGVSTCLTRSFRGAKIPTPTPGAHSEALVADTRLEKLQAELMKVLEKYAKR